MPLHSNKYVLKECQMQTSPLGKHFSCVYVCLLAFAPCILTPVFSYAFFLPSFFLFAFLRLPDAAQLYQQYSEAAQNFEILRQARSDVVSASEDATPSPAPSPPPARRPLPPLPTVKHPHSLSKAGSISSFRSLPLPEPPKTERRASSPRLSISLAQSATLWRELPAVRNSTELGELTEDQRRLQEVTQLFDSSEEASQILLNLIRHE